ncbi:hypothetical protein N7486_008936 [Penicillium sp. IBT 16267x]|nr:hypothetical protein N7486_008936 [Penicillium sp. IBT 16267x]
MIFGTNLVDKLRHAWTITARTSKLILRQQPAPPQRFAVPSVGASGLCDDRQPIPGLWHLIGATLLTTCFCWRFAAVKHWPDASPGNTPKMLCTQRLR